MRVMTSKPHLIKDNPLLRELEDIGKKDPEYFLLTKLPAMVKERRAQVYSSETHTRTSDSVGTTQSRSPKQLDPLHL